MQALADVRSKKRDALVGLAFEDKYPNSCSTIPKLNTLTGTKSANCKFAGWCGGSFSHLENIVDNSTHVTGLACSDITTKTASSTARKIQAAREATHQHAAETRRVLGGTDCRRKLLRVPAGGWIAKLHMLASPKRAVSMLPRATKAVVAKPKEITLGDLSKSKGGVLAPRRSEGAV